MTLDDALRCRECSDVTDRISAIADRTGLGESEVCRRLLRLGLDDIDQLGDDALLLSSAVDYDDD